MTNSTYNTVQYLTLLPNNEVRFVSRPVVESKAKGPSEVKEFNKGMSPVVAEYLQARGIYVASDAIAGEAEVTPLDSRSQFQESKKAKNGYGAIPEKWPNFTAKAKRQLNLRASAISNAFPKENQVFITGTLPGSTDAAIAEFAKWSSWFMNRVQVWLYDNFALDEDYNHLTKATDTKKKRFSLHCAVWEHQKRGALHYHGLVATAKPQELMDKFKPFWIDLLEQKSSETGVDLFRKNDNWTWRIKPTDTAAMKEHKFSKIQVISQEVKSSISSYLSKYLSKDASKEPEDMIKNPPPARWWACTRALKKLSESQTILLHLPSGTTQQSEALLTDIYDFMKDLAAFSCPLINPYSRQHYGSIGIFNDRDEAFSVFELMRSEIEPRLEENEADIDLMARMSFSSEWAKLNRRKAALASQEIEHADKFMKERIRKQFNKSFLPDSPPYSRTET